MLLSLLSAAAFAEGGTEAPPVCTCETACTAESRNTDCPVCGAEGARPEDCTRCTVEQVEGLEAASTHDLQPAGDGISVQAEHTHCICGGSVTAGNHTSHEDVTYTAWNGTDSIAYTNHIAYVYLTGNATLSSDLIVDGRTLYLCLNGKRLSSNGTKKLKVRNSAHLVLCDCQGGCSIKGVTSGWGGGCVYLYESTLDLFSGTLTGAKVKNGGGVALNDANCTLTMVAPSPAIPPHNAAAAYIC